MENEKKLGAASKYNKIASTMPECLQNYLYTGMISRSLTTKLAYLYDLKYFFEFCINMLPYFPDKSIDQLTFDDFAKIRPLDINQYISYMSDVKISPKTQARRKSAVSSMYNYLVYTQEVLKTNPVKGSIKIKIPEKEFVIYLTIPEQEKLLATIQTGCGLTGKQVAHNKRTRTRDTAIIFLFLDTGLRVSELSNINIEDINLNEYSVIVQRKGGKIQEVFFSDESRNYLETYLYERKQNNNIVGKDPLFVSSRGTRLSIREIQHMVEKYTTAALPERVSQISPHKLRSSFAMSFYRHEQNIVLLQKRMNHSTLAATSIYVKALASEEKASRNWRTE